MAIEKAKRVPFRFETRSSSGLIEVRLSGFLDVEHAAEYLHDLALPVDPLSPDKETTRDAEEGPNDPHRPRRLDWTKLLTRVFATDRLYRG